MSDFTDNQIKVIKLMQEGWIMTVMAGHYRKIFIQKGTETFKIYATTFRELLNKQLIELEGENFPFSIYSLTEKGKNI